MIMTKNSKKTSKGKKTSRHTTLNQFNSFTPRQTAKYEDSLEVLSIMRKGNTIKEASKQVGISIPTVKKYVGSALKLKNHRLVANQSDRLLRKIRIYENGKESWITVRGNKKSSVIAQYHSAIGQRLETHNSTALKPFENKSIIDSKGRHHRFETDVKKLVKIFEKREEPEFFTIYQRR
jgi:hypothetical protein